MDNVISSFTGEYRFLSNFYFHPFYYKERRVPTAEHAYQATKATSGEDFSWILNAETPSEAKERGREIRLRDDWDNIKVETMYNIVKAKFKSPYIYTKLIKTGDAKLIEGNWWGDRFWGVCKGEGKNMLGKILMKVRKEIR